ncbi:2-succinyl-5-enolpyruvyl-6-hydroxy-3-cyclohexene-1-carboxylic-acid synthase [Adhaeribacter rhizoryzae]|uniref:2-succinyl-5-enolpyruvyl-6-hydroxy-3-cyclohexene-1-carboxylate synthase n=1 Tax=Adhaeribacter rhizoryzae TaxID=2607907 RepID=A0A5M6CY52_9BACT|nr:2-succinyl-5-enolpyruvyl-6-hydroxy-3-cyclohexene-1-carboxylic-acid synthase [Adhaeribacter rhizoryzae]KAA5540147.1 2-succinyl-5-enolpyruvyl-6-hydroxy-3-cyclohexene-1-carboxylic-acid synthase [Adhaeribacter rhizoryzae]
MNLQAVFNIAEICAQWGVQQVVLSPGSRCAPLTLAFARHPKIQVRTISDERAAAFIGLGIALTTRRPVVLVCTSGTAALNYAPAVAEAFYQQVPLLVITADRPAEWIDQLDGQTIRQENIYGRHIKKSFSFPSEGEYADAIWYGQRMLSEALLETEAYPPGPVHINVPLREPFYPKPDEPIHFEKNVKVIRELPNAYELSSSQINLLKFASAGYQKILVLAGQGPYEEELVQALQAFARNTGAVIVADVIANLHEIPGVCRYQDIYLAGKNTPAAQDLQPDLLITFGLSNISKNLKLFLRAYPPQAHWHLQPAGTVADPFQSLTQIIRTTPLSFFSALRGTHYRAIRNYRHIWQQQEKQANVYLKEFLHQPVFNEFTGYFQVINNLPQNVNLHLANSMAVRYANIIGLKPQQQVVVFANRGTSGIDGCTSTAVGSALSSANLTILITGDLAFFYDRNGLWHNYLPPNLRIVLLNNQGGGIFRLIDGPRQQPELAEFFETHQALNAEQTAKDFKMAYFPCRNLPELTNQLPHFWQAGPGILEIFTSSPENADFFNAFKQGPPFKIT